MRQIRLALSQSEPGLAGQGDDALFNQFEVALDLLLIATETQLEGVFEHDGQQFGRGLAAENRPLETGSQQIGNTPDVIDMHVGGDQGLDRIQEELDGPSIGRGFALGRGFRALEQAAVDQPAVLGAHQQLMAGAGHAVFGAVVEDVGVVHVIDPC